MLTSNLFHQHCLSSEWYKHQLKILVACSGGVDSTVLLHLFNEIPEFSISIVHFDHQLRGVESTRDREFVQKLGANLGYEVHVISEDIRAYAQSNGLSLEEAGSLRRRLSFAQIKDELGYDLVATGQHFDDQIETILMNLYMGAGFQGLAGISERNDCFIRPLLFNTRREILAFSEAHDLEVCSDSSNSDISFLRNNLRANLIPVLSNENDERLRASIEGIFLEGQLLNRLVETSSEDIDINGFSTDYVSKIALGLGVLPDYFSPIQKAIFDRAFQSISLMPQGISSRHFDAMKSLFSDNSIGKEVQLPASVTAVRDRSDIVFFKRSDYYWSSTMLTDSNQTAFPFFRLKVTTSHIADHIRDPGYLWYTHALESYTIRPAEPGDKMIVHESGRSRSIYQILQSARVAPHLKAYYPVVELHDEIIWVPGIRTAPSAMISEKIIKANRSKHCVKIQFQEGTFE
jgi:tRNA(Ile)-lysidine synthetase-like protein